RDPLSLAVLGCHVLVECEDPDTRALLMVNYGAMQGQRGAATLRYRVARHPRSSAFVIRSAGQAPLLAPDAGALLWAFDHALTLALQRLRRDLYFVHAAVLEAAGRAVLLVGPSGGGKSTTTWALLHHGFGYLSDELGPVDLPTGTVLPYPRALILKQ